jgi:hypothetical protein
MLQCSINSTLALFQSTERDSSDSPYTDLQCASAERALETSDASDEFSNARKEQIAFPGTGVDLGGFTAAELRTKCRMSVRRSK